MSDSHIHIFCSDIELSNILSPIPSFRIKPKPVTPSSRSYLLEIKTDPGYKILALGEYNIGTGCKIILQHKGHWSIKVNNSGPYTNSPAIITLSNGLDSVGVKCVLMCNASASESVGLINWSDLQIDGILAQI